MICILHVSPEGRVVATNRDALEFLGPSVGRRCCDVVGATSARRFLCAPDCAQRVADDVSSTSSRTATIRGQLCRLACSRVGDQIVVAIIPQRGSDVPVAVPLSPRERQALRGVSEGKTNAQIASEMGVAESTVRSHLDAARAKLGATTRAHAVALAMATRQLT